MATKETLTASYTSEFPDSASGSVPEFYIDLEQEPWPEDDKAKVYDTADFIDSLFQLDPCAGDNTGMVELEIDPETGEPVLPFTEEQFEEAAFEKALAEFCYNVINGFFVNLFVYRHDTDIPYDLDFTHSGTEIVRTRRYAGMTTEEFTIDNQFSFTLRRPVIDPPVNSNLIKFKLEIVTAVHINGDMDVEDTTIPYTVYGRTIQFEAEEGVTGTFIATHYTEYDTVRVKLPQSEAGMPLETVAYAYYLGLIDDENIAWKELDSEITPELCEEGAKNNDPNDYNFSDDNRCYQIIHVDELCRCTKHLEDTKESKRYVACPEGTAAGGFVGVKRYDKYVSCDEEEQRIHTTEFYEEVCCEEPNRPLPFCQTTYAIHRGGVPIDRGRDWYKEKYGPNTIFVPVVPKDGICGDDIQRWNVDELSCCDFPDEILYAPGTEFSGAVAWESEHTYCASLDSGTPPFTFGVDGSGISLSDKQGGSCTLAKVAECMMNPAVIYAKDTCNWYAIWLVWPSGGSWASTDVTTLTSPYKWHHDGTTPAFRVHGFSGDRTMHSIQSYRSNFITPVGTDGAPPTAQEIETQCCDSSTCNDYQTSSVAAVPENLDGFQKCGGNIWYKEHPLNPGQYIRYYATEGDIDHIRYTEEYTEPVIEELEYDDENSAETVADNSSATVYWFGGVTPFEISVSGQDAWADAGHTTTETTTNNRHAGIYVGESCGSLSITITDFCGEQINGSVRAAEGEWITKYDNTSSYGGGVLGFTHRDTGEVFTPPYEGGCPKIFSRPGLRVPFSNSTTTCISGGIQIRAYHQYANNCPGSGFNNLQVAQSVWCYNCGCTTKACAVEAVTNRCQGCENNPDLYVGAYINTMWAVDPLCACVDSGGPRDPTCSSDPEYTLENYGDRAGPEEAFHNGMIVEYEGTYPSAIMYFTWIRNGVRIYEWVC